MLTNYCNNKTKLTSSVLGFLLGLAGLVNHGVFEILQGNINTNAMFIEAIGESHRFWEYGTEGAFTLIPNFLITGICVLLVSLVLMVWSIKFIHKKYGSTGFLLLVVLLTLVGGGIGHIILSLTVWLYSTRINKPLNWWNRFLSDKTKKLLSKMWLPMLVATNLSWLVVMELGIFGFVPGVTNSELILNICLGFVLLTAVLANVTYVCGFAGDIHERA